jgi:hypothetical protein
MPDKGLSFGIGCIYFYIESGNILEWEPSVRSTLEAIPSITNLAVSRSEPITVKENNKYPAAAVISFDVTIPSRIREQILILWRYPNIGERFKVIIIYELFHPVIFVVQEEGDKLDGGSSSVILVREFLKRELEARPGAAKLRSLGPSPFHVDASLEPAEQSEDFTLNRVRRRGYDRYGFRYSEESFPSSHEAAARLFSVLAYELAVYYDLIETRNNRAAAIREIARETQELIQRQEKGGIFNRVAYFFTSGSMMQRISLKSLRAEYDLQRGTSEAQGAIDNLYSSDQFPCFRDYLEQEAQSPHADVISNTKDIVSLLSQGRSQQVQVASLFLSALAGGLAGALVSIFVH